MQLGPSRGHSSTDRRAYVSLCCIANLEKCCQPITFDSSVGRVLSYLPTFLRENIRYFRMEAEFSRKGPRYGALFRRGLQDGYFSFKPHVESELVAVCLVPTSLNYAAVCPKFLDRTVRGQELRSQLCLPRTLPSRKYIDSNCSG